MREEKERQRREAKERKNRERMGMMGHGGFGESFDFGDYGDEMFGPGGGRRDMMMMMFGRGRDMPPPLPQLKEPDIVIDQKYIDTKEWERQYNKWLMQNGEKPGNHPDPNHEWNTNPEKFINGEDEAY